MYIFEMKIVKRKSVSVGVQDLDKRDLVFNLDYKYKLCTTIIHVYV